MTTAELIASLEMQPDIKGHWRGPKYDPNNNDIAAIAKSVRTDIAKAVKDGALPTAKYSVRVHRYSMGQSLNIYISELPFGIVNRRRVEIDTNNEPHWMTQPLHNDQAREVVKAVEAIANQYNYDRSESQTDYFDCDFYLHVNLDPQQFDVEREAIIAELKAAKVAR